MFLVAHWEPGPEPGCDFWEIFKAGCFDEASPLTLRSRRDVSLVVCFRAGREDEPLLGQFVEALENHSVGIAFDVFEDFDGSDDIKKVIVIAAQSLEESLGRPELDGVNTESHDRAVSRLCRLCLYTRFDGDGNFCLRSRAAGVVRQEPEARSEIEDRSWLESHGHKESEGLVEI